MKGFGMSARRRISTHLTISFLNAMAQVSSGNILLQAEEPQLEDAQQGTVIIDQSCAADCPIFIVRKESRVRQLRP